MITKLSLSSGFRKCSEYRNLSYVPDTSKTAVFKGNVRVSASGYNTKAWHPGPDIIRSPGNSQYCQEDIHIYFVCMVGGVKQDRKIGKKERR